MRAPMLELLPGAYSGRIAQPRKPEERLRVEQILAVARVLLGVAAVATTYLSFLVAFAPPARAARVLFIVYALQAVIVLTILRSAKSPPGSSLTRTIHAADLVWAAALTMVTSGAASPFFMLFLFALLGAAYRWGWYETLASGGVACAIAVAPGLWAPGAPGAGGGGGGA